MKSSRISQAKKPHTRNIYYQRKLKGFRIDKRIPRRFSVQTEEDLGSRKVIDKWTLPRVEHEHRDYAKEENGNWASVVSVNGFKVKKALREDRYFMYLKDEYQGELSSPDLFKIAFAFLKSLNEITLVVNKRVRGKTYQRWMLRTNKNVYRHRSYAH